MHLELFNSSPETEHSIRSLVSELSAGTLAEEAKVVTFVAATRLICWNCCGLRFESDSPNAVCPNCGHLGMLIPLDVTFALDHVEIA